MRSYPKFSRLHWNLAMTNNSERTIRLSTASLIAAALILIQLLITQWTVRAASSEEIVAYVSFSGTITSMLLAVLAIVYSYYTAASQKSDADRIATQIASLSSTAQTLSGTEERLAQELDRLKEIRKQLDDVQVDVKQGTHHAAAARDLIQARFHELESQKQTAEAIEVEAPPAKVSTAASETKEPVATVSEGKRTSLANAQLRISQWIAENSNDFQCLPYLVAYYACPPESKVADTVRSLYTPLIREGVAEDLAISSAMTEVFAYTMVFVDLTIHRDACRAEFAKRFAQRILQIKADTFRSDDPYVDTRKVVEFLKAKANELVKGAASQ
jgi:hypothetical protein